MADEFDPYYQWLGIPPKYRPPSYYRLLAIEEFESNADVIENAADRQMAHVRLYQNGPQGDLSQKLLNELTAAKICLLNPTKKAAYDQQLQSARPAAEPPAQPINVSPVRAMPLPPANPAQPFDEALDVIAAPPSSAPLPRSAAPQVPAPPGSYAVGSASRPSLRKRQGLPQAALIGIGAGAALIVLLALAILWPKSADRAHDSRKNSPDTSSKSSDVHSKDSAKEKGTATIDAKNPADKKIPASKSELSEDGEKPKTTKKLPEGNGGESGAVDPPDNQEADLLKQVDAQRDAAAGEWRVARGVLRGSAIEEHALLRLPRNCPREYDLTIAARRGGGDGVLVVGLVVGKERVALLCDSDHESKKTTLLHVVKDFAVGKTAFEGEVFPLGALVTLQIQIRTVGIAVIADDRQLFTWRGNPAELSLAPLWAKRSPGEGLFLGMQDARFDIEKCELRAVISSSPAIVSSRRVEVPPDAERKPARVQVLKLFDAEIKGSRSAKETTALVERLMQQALREEESATKFALLEIAAELAVEASDAALVAKVIEQLSAAFDLSRSERLLAALSQIADQKLSPEKRKAWGDTVLSAADNAAQDQNFAAASELLALAQKVGAKEEDAELRKRATAARERVDQSKLWWEDAEKAREILATQPDDPAANGALGKFLCLAQGEWDRGLPYLAKADDAKLKAAAKLESGMPESPVQQQAAGDAWWDLSQGASGHAKLVYQRRSHHWYEQAVAGLTEPAKAAVEKRIAALEKIWGESSTGGASSALVKRIIGEFHLQATGKKAKKSVTLAFTADGRFAIERTTGGSWLIDDNQVRLTFEDAAEGTAKLRANGQGSFTGQQTLENGDIVSWQLRQVVVASTWALYDERFSRESQRMVLYSNGKINDINSDDTWSLAGNQLTLNWDSYTLPGVNPMAVTRFGLRGTFTIQAGGRLFRGQDSRGRPYRGERVANKL